MGMYRKCPRCAANLDATEVCDCTLTPDFKEEHGTSQIFCLESAQKGAVVDKQTLASLSEEKGVLYRSPASVQLRQPHVFARSVDGSPQPTYPTFLRVGRDILYVGFCFARSVTAAWNS